MNLKSVKQTMMNNDERDQPQRLTQKEILVQKLQGALQEFRRERDQLHRSKELALERCRLVREEEETLLKTVSSLKEKHDKLEKAIYDSKARLGPLEEAVQHKTKETQFQHMELIKAREKIKDLNQMMEKSAKEREARLFDARKLVCKCRNKFEAMEREEEEAMNSLEEPFSLDAQKEALTRELNCMFDWSVLPKLMEQKGSSLAMKAQKIHDKALGLKEGRNESE